MGRCLETTPRDSGGLGVSPKNCQGLNIHNFLKTSLNGPIEESIGIYMTIALSFDSIINHTKTFRVLKLHGASNPKRLNKIFTCSQLLVERQRIS